MVKQDREKFRIIEEDSVPVSVNPDHPVPVKTSPGNIAFTEDLTIGAADGDQNYIFSDSIKYTVDDKGNVYVLDCRQYTVKKFDNRGKYMLSFGRRGQGPGEFVHPVEVKFLPNGRIVVFELESQKFSCFSTEGHFIASKRFQGRIYPPYFGLSSGNFIATRIIYEDDKTTVITGLFNNNSKMLASFYKKETGPYQLINRSDPDERAKEIARILSKAAFRKETKIAIDQKENIYYAFTEKYEIKIYSPEAKLKKIIRTLLPLLPVEEKDREDFLKFGPQDITTWRSMDKGLKNKIKSLIKFPSKKPAFLEMLCMDNGYLMVIRDRETYRNSLINIFDHDGRLIIERRLAFVIKEGLCRKGRIYSIYEDEDGYKFIKRYRYKMQTKKRGPVP
jgi:hypothetical protein